MSGLRQLLTYEIVYPVGLWQGQAGRKYGRAWGEEWGGVLKGYTTTKKKVKSTFLTTNHYFYIKDVLIYID